ncbi:MAG: GNAT family N-acetyltransferase [Acholeplasmatales bacterium]|jgi:GNAT superfamily N-acetyltransferase|nr:GNAT family N-acetyltransferase [Acholeplasmatales bacterium]
MEKINIRKIKYSSIKDYLIEQKIELDNTAIAYFDQEINTIFLNEKIIGFSFLDFNYIHPYSHYLNIYISPEYRRRGFGTTLFNQLILETSLDRLQCGIENDNLEVKLFLEKIGFILIKTTCLPIVTISDIKPLVGNNHKIKFSKFKWNKILEKDFYNFYYNLHLNNPIGSSVTTKYLKYYLSCYSKKYSYQAKINDQISYIICFEHDDELEVGYFRANLESQETKDISFSFILAFLDQVHDKFNKLSFEVDDNDENGLFLLKALNVVFKNDYLTYQLKVPYKFKSLVS